MSYVYQEPVRGSYPDPRYLALSGQERMRLFDAERGPIPPIAYLTGMRPLEFGDGTSLWTMPASGWFMSSQGHIAAGALTIMADGPLGSVVGNALPAGTGMTTAEISMTFLRPVPGDGSALTARGRLIHLEPPLGLSETFIENSAGELVAHGTSIVFVFPPIPGLEPPDDLTLPERPTYEGPDPYLRPHVGEPIPWEEWRKLDGLKVLHRQMSGELPSPPIHYLTGLSVTEASQGEVTFEMPASEWLCNPGRTIQGGAVGLVAHSALATSVITTLEAGTAYTPVDLKINFLRPAYPTGENLVAKGRVVHRGNTLAVANAEVLSAEGKRVATATGSTRITPERLEA